MAEEEPTPKAGLDDTLAANRVVSIVSVSEVPRVPANYRPTPIEERRKELRKVDEEMVPEMVAGLTACAERGDGLQEELGKKAPPAKEIAAVVERIVSVQKTKRAAVALVSYLSEVEDLALSDGLLLLEKVKKLYDINGEDPNLPVFYQEMLKFFTARGAKISQGIAEKKAKDAQKLTDTKAE